MWDLRQSLPHRVTRCPTRCIAGGLAEALAPVLALVLVLGLTCVAVSDVVVLTATRDNTIFSNGNSNGAGDAIFSGRVGGFGGGVVQRGLLRFNVADGVPAASRVITATVELSLIMASFEDVPSSHGLHV